MKRAGDTSIYKIKWVRCENEDEMEGTYFSTSYMADFKILINRWGVLG